MKKRMKKAVSLTLAAATVLSLAACGNGGDFKEGTSQAAIESGTISNGEVTLKPC